MMDPVILAVGGATLSACTTAVAALFTWSLARNIRSLDGTLKELSTKITSTAEQVVALEKQVAVLQYRADEKHG